MFKFGRKKKDPAREVDPEPEALSEPLSEPLTEPEQAPNSALDQTTDLAPEQKEKIGKRAKLGGYL